MCRVFPVPLVLACAVPIAFSQTQNHVYQHNLLYQDPSDPNLPNIYYYDVVHEQGLIVIHHALEGQSFEFEAAVLDGNGQYVEPGHIESIAADENAGPVTITLVGHGHDYGAQDVDAITLMVGGVNGIVGDVIISGNMAADAILTAHDIAGTCLIGDPSDPQTGHVLNPIVLDCFSGTLECNELRNFTVENGCPGLPAATLKVHGSYSHTLTIAGSPTDPELALVYIGDDEQHELNGTVTINRSVHTLSTPRITGTVHVAGDMHWIDPWGGTRGSGLLQIDGDVGYGIIGGIGAGSTVRLGRVVGTHFGQSVRVGTSGYDGVGMEGLLDVATDAVDLHMYALTAPGALIHVGGDTGILGFNVDMLGLAHVEGDLTRQLIVGEAGADPNFTPPADLAGEVRIDGRLGNHPEVDCDVLISRGDLSGVLSIGGDCEGAICLLQGNLTGRLAVGAYPNAIHHLSGSARIHGDLASDAPGDGIEVAGNLIDPNNDGRGGRIMIDGGFGEYRDSQIIVHGGLGPGRTGIAVDFDGYHATDRWGASGRVEVAGQSYWGNTPSMHIYEITGCKGDGDNSGSVSPSDTIAMLLAMQGEDFYRPTYPGLEGSMLFHCDITGPNPYQCDGVIDALDFDLLPVRFGTCSTLCGAIDADEGPSAAALAATLREHVPAELRGVLRAVVDDLRQNHPRPVRRTYWQAVRQHLGE